MMTPKPKGGARRPSKQPDAETTPAARPLRSDTPPPFSLPHDLGGAWDEGNDVAETPSPLESPGGFRSSFTPSFTLIGSGPSHGTRSQLDSLSPGSIFGVYLVGECIGQGGMARIYQAEHSGLRRQVALKVLIDGFARDLDGRERFLREARLAAAIRHPNVVHIFDVGVQDDIPYLVMELLEGQDVEKLLESRGALDEGLIVDIMIPVVAGLTAVHDAGIVHRDLKPGNIFLANSRYNDLEPKLLDFGISKAQGPEALRLTANRGIMGTPLYIAPEGLHGGDMTALSDQYSLGVVMYECATGCTPYNASAFADLSRLIVSGQYTRPNTQKPDLSRRLARIIERSMSLRPQDRFKDMREMGRELLTVAGHRTRITWGLSFDEVRRDVSPALAGGMDHHEGVRGKDGPSEREAARGAAPAQTPPRRRAVAAWLLAPLLLVFVVYDGWRSGMVSFHSSSSGRTASEVSRRPANEDLRNAPTDSRADPIEHVAFLVPAIPTRLEEPPEVPLVAATDLPIASPPAPTRPSESHPARIDTAQTATRRNSPSAWASPTRRPGIGSDADPEWALPQAGTSGRASPQIGANGSPILD